MNIAQVVDDLSTAAQLNRMSDIYYRNLSIALLMQTNEAIQDPTANPNEVVDLVVRAVNTAKKATEI